MDKKKEELPNTVLCSAVCLGTPPHLAQLIVKAVSVERWQSWQNLHPTLQDTNHPTHEISTHNAFTGVYGGRS